jgi:hypothetical protein
MKKLTRLSGGAVAGLRVKSPKMLKDARLKPNERLWTPSSILNYIYTFISMGYPKALITLKGAHQFELGTFDEHLCRTPQTAPRVNFPRYSAGGCRLRGRGASTYSALQKFLNRFFHIGQHY